MPDESTARRVIQVNRSLIGPPAPRPNRVRVRPLSDYADRPQAHRDVARKYSRPLLMGPPICDELMALVQHLFTEEEASAVRHLGTVRGRTAGQVARAEHRPEEAIEPILQRLADEKRVLFASGPPSRRRYRILPLLPGTFELSLVSQRLDTMSPWHRRLAELFENLFDTGFLLAYQQGRAPTFFRYLPVAKAIEAHPMALPSDKLEVVLEQHDVFGVGNCQCRLTAHAAGRGCGKPLRNCLVMGPWVTRFIDSGLVQRVSKQEALDLKREAEEHGLVNWMIDYPSNKIQSSCACCGCCCKAMRMVNEFSAPRLFAPPHFVPQHDASRCTACGQCAQKCPLGAITVTLPTAPAVPATDAASVPGSFAWNEARCIGCGLCTLACDRRRALTMTPVPDYRRPYRSWFSFLAKSTPGVLTSVWHAWRSRRE